MRNWLIAFFVASLALPTAASAQSAPASAQGTPSPAPSALKKRLSVHLQLTNTQQYHGAFAAPYSGSNSLQSTADTEKTFSGTLFLGARLWKGGEAYLNPEIDQGFGFGNGTPGQPYNGTFGVAAYPNGEAYKVGAYKWYGRLHRYFIRQTFNQGGGKAQEVEDDQNQLAGELTPNHVIVTGGKFNVTDVFDNNPYAHDPRNDFLNWAMVDGGAFDYAADAWGFTYGVSAEFVRSNSAFRVGVFQLSKTPNTTIIEKTPFLQYSPIVEFERDTSFFGGHPGSIKILGYGNYGYMAPYADATAYGIATGTPANTALFRQNRYWKLGGELNIAQELAPNVGAFLRYSAQNGTYEIFDFTDIDRSLEAGLSFNGAMWHRPADTFAIGGVLNALSVPAINYFEAGGAGVVIGDGGLTYGGEHVLETYYKLGVVKTLSLKFDYQFVANPAYNTVRGPVSLFGLQIHEQL